MELRENGSIKYRCVFLVQSSLIIYSDEGQTFDLFNPVSL